jgi:hypothetical protein
MSCSSSVCARGQGCDSRSDMPNRFPAFTIVEQILVGKTAVPSLFNAKFVRDYGGLVRRAR